MAARRRLLRRGRELRGPVSLLRVPVRTSRAQRFELLAHEVAQRLALAAELPAQSWTVRVLDVPGEEPALEHRWGHVRRSRDHSELQVFRLAVVMQCSDESEWVLVLEQLFAELFAEATGRLPEEFGE